MLKDGNKMEATTFVKENDMLKKELERLREAKESMSPNSGDQKLQYY
jgi:hypothetical protein